MSLRINTNIPAMTALSNLNNVNDRLAQSITRLSTGLRINSAADDPSGLVISENMKSQISGIGQAIQNAQDAVNMAKTADGAMSEVSSMLQNIRTIAVGAANSAVMDASSLQADQSEIQSTISSINNIATTTQWGTKTLLDGTSGVAANIMDITDVAGAYIGSSFNGMPIATGAMTIQRTTAATQSTVSTAKAFASTAAVVGAGSVVVNGYTFTSDGTTTTVQSLVDAINAQSANTGVQATTVPSGGNVNIQLQSSQYGSNTPINFFDSSAILGASVNTTGIDAVANVTMMVNTPSGPQAQTVQFTGGKGTSQSGLVIGDSAGNTITLTPTGNNGATLGAATNVGAITVGSVQFQIGGQANQTVSFGMPDIRASQLGTGAIAGQNLSTIDLTTAAGATNAIKIIDNAISQLSQQRGNLGSFQSDFLNTTMSSLQVANTNLSSSESSIQDVDMASEMTQYTKEQILVQSGVSVLGQANQIPQQILSLLKSG